MIAALVLAGGSASRLGGGDKTLLPLGAATVLHMLLARLRPQAAALAISANGDPLRFARFAFCKRPEVLDEAVLRLERHFARPAGRATA